MLLLIRLLLRLLVPIRLLQLRLLREVDVRRLRWLVRWMARRQWLGEIRSSTRRVWAVVIVAVWISSQAIQFCFRTNLLRFINFINKTIDNDTTATDILIAS